MDSSYIYICNDIMEARGIPLWVLEAYEVEQAVWLAYSLCTDGQGIFKILIGRLFDGVYDLGSKKSTGEEYVNRLVSQVNHKRALKELKRRTDNGDKEAAEILNKGESP
jgi:hypothetical protein